MTKAELIKTLQDDPHPDDYLVEVEVYTEGYGYLYPDIQRVGGNATDGYVCLAVE